MNILSTDEALRRIHLNVFEETTILRLQLLFEIWVTAQMFLSITLVQRLAGEICYKVLYHDV